MRDSEKLLWCLLPAGRGARRYLVSQQIILDLLHVGQLFRQSVLEEETCTASDKHTPKLGRFEGGVSELQLDQVTFSSRAAILSFRCSCSLSLDSDSSLSTVSDRRLLCSSFMRSRCLAWGRTRLLIRPPQHKDSDPNESVGRSAPTVQW